MTPRAKRRWYLALIAIALLVAGWLGSASFVAWKLTHRRHPLAPETIPTDFVDTATEVRLATSDHEDLGAWWVAGDTSKPVVVLLHGLGGCRSLLAKRMRILRVNGNPMLAVTLRAHGDSSGEKVDAGWSSRADVLAAVKWIEARHADARIVIDGTSMGAAAALFAAPDLADRVDGYVLESPYRDLRTAVKNRLELSLPPLFDQIAWAGLLVVSPIFLPDLDRIAPIDCAGSIPPATPVLIIASSADKHARPAEAREILSRLHGNGELVLFEDALHDRVVETHPDQWAAAIGALLAKVTAAPRVRR